MKRILGAGRGVMTTGPETSRHALPGTVRHWTALEALGCWVLLYVTGFSLAEWHPWWQVRFPDQMPYPVTCAIVTGLAWLLMSGLGDRIPREATWVGAAVLFVGFFHFDLARVPLFHGSDHTEALELGANALVHGHDPYALTTHLGNSIGPLLGGLLLVLPLYAVAGSLVALIPLAWAGGVVLAERLVSRAGFVVSGLLVASPWTRAQLPWQDDNATNAFAVVLCSGWGWWLARNPHQRWVRWLWVLAFACALDYRWTMWVVGLPYLVLFVRSFGWGRAVRWLGPVLAATLVLFVLPFALSPGFTHRVFLTDQMQHQAGPWGEAGTVLVSVMTAAALVAGSVFVRSLVGVWAVTAAGLATMLIGFGLVTLPDLGVEAAFYRYNYVSYCGWVLVFGIAALVAPRPRSPAST